MLEGATETKSATWWFIAISPRAHFLRKSLLRRRQQPATHPSAGRDPGHFRMPDDPLQRSPQSPASVPTSSNRERALPQTGFYDGPCFSGNSPSTPLASGSKPTLEQLTRSSRGASRRLALVHTVSKQDTLASIALSYGCSVSPVESSRRRRLCILKYFPLRLTANRPTTIEQALGVRPCPLSLGAGCPVGRMHEAAF